MSRKEGKKKEGEEEEEAVTKKEDENDNDNGHVSWAEEISPTTNDTSSTAASTNRCVQKKFNNNNKKDYEDVYDTVDDEKKPPPKKKIYERLWNKMYQNLIAYKKQYRTTIVPKRYKGGQNLGTWVYTQRQCYKKKEMSIERINYLESIGFVWKIRECVPWVEMYERLVAYKHRHQSTMVPSRYTEDPSLGMWVVKQRVAYKKDKLSEKRTELLNSIDFVWSVKAGK
mmetsp:Transcript_22228/g.25020  ORF Transcript_22228/g.25020 Transcript_22228/m.25020 type:complete len:227 (+) Transcript_22228:148-828(+)